LEPILYALLFLGAFSAMEVVAYYAHKHVMHGSLWCLHKSHHRRREGLFELNDLFAVFFAMPAIALIWFGTKGSQPLLWLGLGITAYGAAYFIFHDVIVHRRIRLRYRPRSGYMKRIVQAHWIHHSCQDKNGALSFGFLYAPPVESLRTRRRSAGRAPDEAQKRPATGGQAEAGRLN